MRNGKQGATGVTTWGAELFDRWRMEQRERAERA